jgi:hypothetical protein
MGFLHFIWLYLWIAPHVLLVVIAIVMVRKGLQRDFPIFFSYLLYEFLQFCLLFAMHIWRPSLSTYLEVDVIGRAGSIALRFGIIQEMFESPFTHSFSLRRGMARTLNWVTVVLVVIAAVFAGSVYYPILAPRAFQAYVTAEALNTAQCGLLVLIFLWYRFLGLRMSPFVFGVGLGIGLAAGLDPLILALKDAVSAQNSKIPDFLQLAIYHCAVLVWLYFAQAREKFEAIGTPSPLLHIREWTADLGRIAPL